MPLHDFKCINKECRAYGIVFETLHKHNEKMQCYRCHETLEQQVSAPAKPVIHGMWNGDSSKL